MVTEKGCSPSCLGRETRRSSIPTAAFRPFLFHAVFLLSPLIGVPFVVSAWSTYHFFQMPNRPTKTSVFASNTPGTFEKGKKENKNDNHRKQNCEYELVYSPNFNRHLVVRAIYSDEHDEKSQGKVKKQVLRSYEWLDEAQEAYPMAKIKTMDLPPPPPSRSKDAGEIEWEETFSRIVAGAGLKEDSIYYRKKEDPMQADHNGASYLLKFLQKLYSSLPTLTPAEVHRGVMDKFPRLAVYDAALVHERLFFLLSPLPPEDILRKLEDGTLKKKTSNRKRKVKSPGGDLLEKNATDFFDDFPVLFFEYGYGAGFTQAQLIQALQTIPQFWLPIYLSDASCSLKKPQEFLPYIFYHLNAHPEVMKDIRQNLDPLLSGVLPADVACLAHARSSLRLSLDQCRVLLHALPTILSCDVEPSWEFYERGPVRSTLHEDTLTYLRLRLQLTPSQVHGLIKTHTRLSTYKAQSTVKPKLDALQNKLGLTSRELQQVVVRMPSVIGISVNGLKKRIKFFTENVGMTTEEMKKSILLFPALSQYSVASLEVKLAFFRDELEIVDTDSLKKVFLSQPVLWGLSLEKNLKPTVSALGNACGLTLRGVGDLISRAPELLLYNWNSSLKPKLDFLSQRLSLSPQQRNAMVVSSPRLLVQSIHNSLEIKIGMIETRLAQVGDTPSKARDIILSNPSLLIARKVALEKRIGSEKKWKKLSNAISQDGTAVSGEIFEDTLIAANERPANGATKKKIVLELSMTNNVERQFSTGKEAAEAASVSPSTMYAAIRNGRVLGGKRYVYNAAEELGSNFRAAVGSTITIPPDKRSIFPTEALDIVPAIPGDKFLKDVRRKHIQDDREKMLVQSTHRFQDSKLNATGCCLAVYVSGRVFPPDDRSQVLGQRRAGGMAIAIPSLPKSFSNLFLQSCEKCFSTQLFSAKSFLTNSETENGLVALLGYPYLRPSRRRCSLYVCREGLRLVRQLFLEVAEASKTSRVSEQAGGKVCLPPPMHIHIITDSNYAFDLVQNTSSLLEWGSKPVKKDFLYTGDTPEWVANTDILWPLSRTYYNLVHLEGNVPTTLQNNLTVTFMLNDVGLVDRDTNHSLRETMDAWAREAAEWQYKRSR